MRPSRCSYRFQPEPTAAPAAPSFVLSAPLTLPLIWSRTGAPSAHIAVQVSLDAGATWTTEATVAGTQTSYNGTVPLGLYRVQAQDSGFMLIGSPSNAESINDLGAVPVLVSNGDGSISWTWTGGQPPQWIIYQSSDGGDSYDRLDGAGGDQRSHVGQTEGDVCYVVAADAFDTPITGVSNVVTV